MRPSVLLAVAYERAQGDKRAILESLWKRVAPAGFVSDAVLPPELADVMKQLRGGVRAFRVVRVENDRAARLMRRVSPER